MDEWVPIVLLIGLLLLGAPILALVALLQLRRLEYRLGGSAPPNLKVLVDRLDALEARVAALAAAIESGAVAVRDVPATAASAPFAGIVPPADHPAPAAIPAVAPLPTPVPAARPAAARSAAARSENLDLETRVAGRWLNRVGLIAVVIGVAFFLKYAVDNAWVGPAGQVSLGVLLGAGLVAWSLRLHRAGHVYFADGLTGLGGAVMYLSLWAAGAYYALLPLEAAFAAMVVVTAALVVMAVGRNSQRVALLALIGGLATPALLSTGADRQVSLFLYLAVLNAAVLPVARSRGWRWIALPAFAGTQLYFWIWYAEFYADSRIWSTTAFAALFFAEFFVLPVLATARASRLPREQVILVFANSALFLVALRAMMWPEQQLLLTVATLMLAAAHLVMARAVPALAAAAREEEPAARLLYAGLALTLATLAIFIGLDGPWIAVAWAIEGAVLVWSGMRTSLRWLRGSGLTLFGLVAWRLLASPQSADRFLLNPRFAVFVVVIACAGLAVWWVFRERDRIAPGEQRGFWLLGIGANVLALLALTLEIYEFFEPPAAARFSRDAYLAAGLTTSLVWTAYASVLLYFGTRSRLAGLRWLGLALVGLTTAKVFLLDFAALTGIYRVVSSLALGIVLLSISFVYQRRLATAPVPRKEEAR
jgi:uncharacterized membrane protein